MKWFKHMSDMADDPRIRKLIRRYSVEGYAVYNLMIERIAKRLSAKSPIPDLEEDAEDLADLLRMDTVRVNEIMLEAMNLELFSQDEVSGRLLCHNIYKFLDASMTGSVDMRKMINAYQERIKSGHVMTYPDKVMTHPDNVSESQDESTQNRREENRREEKREEGEKPPKQERVKKIKHETLSLPLGKTRWENITKKYGEELCNEYLQKIIRWQEAKHGGKRKYTDYAAACDDWMRKDNVQPKAAGQQSRCETCGTLLVDGICFQCEANNAASWS